MVRIATVSSISLVLLGCGSPSSGEPESAASKRAGAPEVTAEELTAPEGHLELGSIVLAEGGTPALALGGDGVLEDKRSGQTIGSLSRDGRFVDSKGALVATLTPAGEVELPNGDFLPVTIDRDGTVSMLTEQRKIRMQDDGSLVGANPQGPVLTISGATQKTRRAAMFVLVLAAFPQRPKP